MADATRRVPRFFLAWGMKTFSGGLASSLGASYPMRSNKEE